MIDLRRDTGAHSRVRSFCIVAALAILVAAASAVAAPTPFGSRTLEVPPPDGMVPIAAVGATYIQAAQAYLPPGNRLIEVYTTPADRDAIARGAQAQLARYFQLQVQRQMEGTPIKASDFTAAQDQMEAGLKQAFAQMPSTAGDLTRQGNDALKRQTGTDPNLALDQVGYLGSFRREPWGMFFTISSRVSATGIGAAGAAAKIVCAGGLVLVNHQVMYLYGYARFDSPADRQWAEDAVSRWADAVHAANPDDAAMESSAAPLSGSGASEPSTGHLARNVMFGALVGALVGLLVYLLRRVRS